MHCIRLDFLNNDELMLLFGIDDINLRVIEQKCAISIIFRDNCLYLLPENEMANTKLANYTINSLLNLIKTSHDFDVNEVRRLLSLEIDDFKDNHLYHDPIVKTYNGKSIFCKTQGQYEYINKLRNFDVCFCSGSAGTGKTYLAVVYGASLLKKKVVERIVLVRPAVEAGENLGFLPGDLKEKIDPYLRPLYDALYDVFGKETVDKQIEKGVIEIAPLAYMRGRTLDNAYVILDEAQNTTKMQMKMFLTRLGFNSRMVITGDVSQTDLPKSTLSGLFHAKNLLSNVSEISFVQLSSKDVVRHPIVKQIIEAYEKENVNG